MSEVSICNSALIKIGAERIISLNDDNKRARICKEQYPKLRDEVLRSHPWNFAIKRTELALTVNTPEFEYDNEYQLPTDCLRVLNLSNQDIKFVIEGDKLLSNESTIKIKYISKVTDTSIFDENFAEALAFRIASELSYTIVQSANFQAQMYQLYLTALRDARSFDAQEGTPPSLIDDSFINSRF